MMKTLVLGLGNELLSDDGIGIFAVNELKKNNFQNVDIIGSSLTGVALIDVLSGYKKAIIIDAIFTKKYLPGTIIEFDIQDLDTVKSPSPHYTGLPEMVSMAKQLNISFPDEIIIFAMEVSDPYTIGGRISAPVSENFDTLLNRVKENLHL